MLAPFAVGILESVLASVVAGSVSLVVGWVARGSLESFSAKLARAFTAPLLYAISKYRDPRTSVDTAPLKRLSAASAELNSALDDLRRIADERAKTISSLQSSIDALVEKERNLKTKIEGTEGISVATAEAFARLVDQKLERAERPKKRRDYALFTAGVIVSVLVGIGIDITKPVWSKLLHAPGESKSIEDHRGTDGKPTPPSGPKSAPPKG